MQNCWLQKGQTIFCSSWFWHLGIEQANTFVFSGSTLGQPASIWRFTCCVDTSIKRKNSFNVMSGENEVATFRLMSSLGRTSIIWLHRGQVGTFFCMRKRMQFKSAEVSETRRRASTNEYCSVDKSFVTDPERTYIHNT